MGSNPKYFRAIRELHETGETTLKCHGNSMLPLLSNPCLNTYRKQSAYQVGDIVFCKVKGRYIDAHKITKKAPDGRYMIANNHGHENGWTNTVYGKVVMTEDALGNVRYFDAQSSVSPPQGRKQNVEASEGRP